MSLMLELLAAMLSILLLPEAVAVVKQIMVAGEVALGVIGRL